MDNDLKSLLDSRHTTDDATLTAAIKANWDGTLLTLRQLEPFLDELRRRFKRLPRKRGVDGNFRTIDGQRHFGKWCVEVLKRPDRTVRHMLSTAKNRTAKVAVPAKAKKATTMKATAAEIRIAYNTLFESLMDVPMSERTPEMRKRHSEMLGELERMADTLEYAQEILATWESRRAEFTLSEPTAVTVEKSVPDNLAWSQI